MSTSPDAQTAALAALRTRENPFDVLARPQQPDEPFDKVHVSGLLHEPRRFVLSVIDAYRVTDYTGEADLPPTRAITIRGARGSGKTHLLHSLIHREDRCRQVLVSPSFFPLDVPFEEYLLAELRQALAEPAVADSGCPFDWIAEALGRRLLIEAVRSLDPVSKLYAAALFGSAADANLTCVDRLCDDLENQKSPHSLSSVLQSHGARADQLIKIAEGHLHKWESGKNSLSSSRVLLFRASLRRTLLGDKEAFEDTFEGDVAPPNATSLARVDAVAGRLRCLIEGCALAGLPIIFAFDNAESLFRVKGQVDTERVRAFFSNVAQAIDARQGIRGFLFLFFAEEGLLEQLANSQDAFSRTRWLEGTRVQGRSMPALIDLQPPTYSEIHLLVKERMRRLLAGFSRMDELPEIFPFSQEFMEKLAEQLEPGHTNTLRAILTQLQHEYRRVVNPPTQPSPDPYFTWQNCLVLAGRQLGTALASHRQALHAGLELLLEKGKGLTCGEWRLHDVEGTKTVGSSTHGLVTVVEWTSTNPSLNENGETPLRLAVGMLLASGSGIRVNLGALLSAFQERSLKIKQLIVLWPTDRKGNLTASLPTATRNLWANSKYSDASDLRSITLQVLKIMLAFPRWLSAVQENVLDPLPEDRVREFVHTHCRPTFDLLIPKPVPVGIPVA